MLNAQEIHTNWPKIKSQVLSKWNKLSAAEVESTHGDSIPLSKLIASKYGEVKDFDKTYEKICEACVPNASRKANSVNTKNEM